QVQLRVQDERFAPQYLKLSTGTGDRTDAGTLSLAPCRTLEGTVVCRETGRPIPGALLTVTGPLNSRVQAVADAEGRFRMHPFPETMTVRADAPAGEPYMIGNHFIDWKDDKDRNVRVTLQRGVFLRGRVTEAGSGRPVAGAIVHFVPQVIGNPILMGRKGGESSIAWHSAHTVSDAGGN